MPSSVISTARFHESSMAPSLALTRKRIAQAAYGNGVGRGAATTVADDDRAVRSSRPVEPRHGRESPQRSLAPPGRAKTVCNLDLQTSIPSNDINCEAWPEASATVAPARGEVIKHLSRNSHQRCA